MMLRPRSLNMENIKFGWKIGFLFKALMFEFHVGPVTVISIKIRLALWCQTALTMHKKAPPPALTVEQMKQHPKVRVKKPIL